MSRNYHSLLQFGVEALLHFAAVRIWAFSIKRSFYISCAAQNPNR